MGSNIPIGTGMFYGCQLQWEWPSNPTFFVWHYQVIFWCQSNAPNTQSHDTYWVWYKQQLCFQPPKTNLQKSQLFHLFMNQAQHQPQDQFHRFSHPLSHLEKPNQPTFPKWMFQGESIALTLLTIIQFQGKNLPITTLPPIVRGIMWERTRTGLP